MILLAEHDEPSLAAKKKRQPGTSSGPTSTPKNRVWSFENTPSGRPTVEPQLSWETATGSVQYTYQIASGRAEWLPRDPLRTAEVSQGPNLYEYVRNNPMSMIDPSGESYLQDLASFGFGYIEAQAGKAALLSSEMDGPIGIALAAGLTYDGMANMTNGATGAINDATGYNIRKVPSTAALLFGNPAAAVVAAAGGSKQAQDQTRQEYDELFDLATLSQSANEDEAIINALGLLSDVPEDSLTTNSIENITLESFDNGPTGYLFDLHSIGGSGIGCL